MLALEDSLDSLELTTLRPRMTELGGVGVGLGGGVHQHYLAGH